MQRYSNFLLLLIFLVAFLSCKEKKKYDIVIKEKEKIKIDIQIRRFDRAIASLSKADFDTKIKSVQKQFPDMFQLYVEGIMLGGKVTDDAYIKRIKPFIMDPSSQELYGIVNQEYPDLKKYEKELGEAFQHVKHYYPKDKIPAIYSMVSNFTYSAISYEKMLVVSLDFFLGANFKYDLDPDKYPRYIKKTMKKEFITAELMKAYFELRFPEEVYSGRDMLSQMIYKGKRLFYLDLMMPETEDSIKIQYTKEQLAWAKRYEGMIWNQIIKNDVLYNSEELKISRYLNEGPFTNAPGMPQETPPRIAEWIGWQIVRKYADQNKGSAVTKVLSEKNSQIILSVSGYKPKIR